MYDKDAKGPTQTRATSAGQDVPTYCLLCLMISSPLDTRKKKVMKAADKTLIRTPPIHALLLAAAISAALAKSTTQPASGPRLGIQALHQQVS